MTLTEHAGVQLARKKKKKPSSAEAKSQGQAVTSDITEPSAPCPSVVETKRQQFGANMGNVTGGRRGGQLELGGGSLHLRVAAMVSVINSCQHPGAALSLAGLQRFSQTVLLSLIKASGCGNKHADLTACL